MMPTFSLLTYLISYPFSPDQQIQLPAWEEYICTLAKVVLQEQSPAG